jgi:hypothetical protein
MARSMESLSPFKKPSVSVRNEKFNQEITAHWETAIGLMDLALTLVSLLHPE